MKLHRKRGPSLKTFNGFWCYELHLVFHVVPHGHQVWYEVYCLELILFSKYCIPKHIKTMRSLTCKYRYASAREFGDCWGAVQFRELKTVIWLQIQISATVHHGTIPWLPNLTKIHFWGVKRCTFMVLNSWGCHEKQMSTSLTRLSTSYYLSH